ncbi:MAG: DUF3082 domain-containing protein [Microcoleus sp.]|uniref:DUF3082 domain-containing protein n=1 Tax=Microcoleus sp. TaxID=44472 RepID=UPI003C73F6CD
MADLTNPNSNSQPPNSAGDEAPASGRQPTVLRCVIGSLMASAFTYGLYSLTVSIALSFASKPLLSTNLTAVKISGAVRTLVVGIVALGTGVFGFAAVGLMLLGLQILIQKLVKKPTS